MSCQRVVVRAGDSKASLPVLLSETGFMSATSARQFSALSVVTLQRRRESFAKRKMADGSPRALFWQHRAGLGSANGNSAGHDGHGK
jgi:hypothetical protein